jgi:hypothetical protein
MVVKIRRGIRRVFFGCGGIVLVTFLAITKNLLLLIFLKKFRLKISGVVPQLCVFFIPSGDILGPHSRIIPLIFGEKFGATPLEQLFQIGRNRV